MTLYYTVKYNTRNVTEDFKIINLYKVENNELVLLGEIIPKSNPFEYEFFSNEEEIQQYVDEFTNINEKLELIEL